MKANKINNRQRTIYMDDLTYNKAVKIAGRNNISVSFLIRQLINNAYVAPAAPIPDQGTSPAK